MSEVIIQPHIKGLALLINNTTYTGSNKEIYQTLSEKWSEATAISKVTSISMLPPPKGRELLRKAEQLTGKITTAQEDDNEQSAILIEAIHENFIVTTMHEGNEVVSGILNTQATQKLLQQLLPYLEQR